jgi:16S rRNA C967 or C1407 C5-methylase (RsmB/RsmF family)
MLQSVKNIYRTVLPESVRRNIALQQWERKRKLLRDEILKYYSDKSNLNDELQGAINYLQQNPLSVFPNEFEKKYNSSDVQVLFDDDVKLSYVMFESKRLYYKRKWSKKRIQEYHNGLLQEQDIASPHRYLTDSFNVGANDLVADVGAAEGIFALQIVQRVKHVYVFEADAEWKEALQETFKPYGERVTIVYQVVSNEDDDKHVSLDKLFADKQIDFIKMDVDGGEANVFKGADKLLSGKRKMKVAVCTYHNQNDEATFTTLLTQNGFDVEVSNGFMIFYFDKNLAPPYFRRGLLRASR